jgi:hypothetical protein
VFLIACALLSLLFKDHNDKTGEESSEERQPYVSGFIYGVSACLIGKLMNHQ